jgi:hypothetical protein
MIPHSSTSTAPPPPVDPTLRPDPPGPRASAPPPPPRAADPAQPNPAAQAFARLGRDVNELKEYASHYLSAKVDGVKRTVRNIALYAALGVVGLIAGGAIVATAAGLLIVGLAEALGVLFGGRFWLGDLVAGILVLGLIGVGAWLMLKKLTGTWRSATILKYERRKQSQRERFGHDAADRAKEAPSEPR